MNYKAISEQFEERIAALFDELRSGMAEREDARAFGAMVEKRITQNWERICQELGYEAVSIPGRRTIFDFACKIDGVLCGFDMKTKDLDTTKYSDGGVCAVGNLLKYLANDKGVFLIVEFGHNKSGEKSDARDLEYIRVAPFHALPKDCYRIENLGTGQVRLNYTINQVWGEIDWERPYQEFSDIFYHQTLNHHRRMNLPFNLTLNS